MFIVYLSGHVIGTVQHERRVVMSHMGSDYNHMNQAYVESLSVEFNNTNKAIFDLGAWPERVQYENYSFPTRDHMLDYLDDQRTRLHSTNTSHIEHTMQYDIAIQALLFGLSDMINEETSKEATIWLRLEGYNLVLRAREYMGIEVVLGDMFFAEQMLTFEQYDDFILMVMLAENCMNSSMSHSDIASTQYANLLVENGALIATKNVYKGFIVNMLDESGLSRADGRALWYAAMSSYLDKLLLIELYIINDILDYTKERVHSANSQLGVATFIIIVVIITIPILFFFIHKLMTRAQHYAISLKNQNFEIRKEKKKADELLYLMLPKSVALQLKMSKKVSAENYNAVTIFFSDICGFTAISARSSPLEVRIAFFGIPVSTKRD